MVLIKHVGEAGPKVVQRLNREEQTVVKYIGRVGNGGDTTIRSEDGDEGKAEGWGNWIVKHPFKTAACVLAAPVSIAATPLVLGAVGFTAGGVAAGSIAAAAHASIGNVAAGSVFAILQSAGAGGAGLAAVNAVVGTVATVGAAGAAVAPSLVKAAKRDENGEEEEENDEEKNTKEEIIKEEITKEK